VATQTERAIAGFWSRTVPTEALCFARALVSQADPPTPQRARNLLFAASRLGAFGLARGLELRPEVLLLPSVTERFTATMPGVSAATRRTVRTNLRHLAARVLPASSPVSLSRERAKAPYSAAEIASYLALADAQPTAARRRRAVALVCLGAGAGLVGADLRGVRGVDVVGRSGGVVVEVGGANARVVPVRAEFCDRLLGAAQAVRRRPLVGTGHPRQRNIAGPLVASLAGGADLGALDVRRLRSTWLAGCAEDLGLRAFLDAAGVRCSQRLGDIVADLDPVCEARAVALLGGRR
jgi:integrase